MGGEKTDKTLNKEKVIVIHISPDGGEVKATSQNLNILEIEMSLLKVISHIRESQINKEK